MKLIKHPIFRKSMFLACLACAALACAEVYQRLFAEAPKPVEEVLMNIHAQKMLIQTITVNGQSVLASAWKVPDYQSVEPVRKARGGSLIVGKTVFTFDSELEPIKGDCVAPEDFPQLSMTCEYLIDATPARSLLGVSTSTPQDLEQQTTAWAAANGWELIAKNVWKKGDTGLYFQASESKRGTEVLIVIQQVHQS